MRSCGAVAARRGGGPPSPGGAGPPVRRGRGVGPADRAPHPAPPYRGVRGVRGSTVGGAHTAHARSAGFHARFRVGSIEQLPPSPRPHTALVTLR